MAAPIRIMSVSLGSRTRDHRATARINGRPFELTRVGTDGSFPEVLRLLRTHDGAVAAFGIGGIEFYFFVNGRRYPIRDARPIRRTVTRTKVGDGDGVKHLLADMAVTRLAETGIRLAGKRALVLSAVDRYGLAVALARAGCDVHCGDLAFGLGLPLTVAGLGAVNLLAPFILPWVCRLPFSWLYPLGQAQCRRRQPGGWHEAMLRRFEVIAGDFLQLRPYLPTNLGGAIIITNTLTSSDLDLLRASGPLTLARMTPCYAGRSFGTNVVEAAVRSVVPKPDEDITELDLAGGLAELGIGPEIELLMP